MPMKIAKHYRNLKLYTTFSYGKEMGITSKVNEFVLKKYIEKLECLAYNKLMLKNLTHINYYRD